MHWYYVCYIVRENCTCKEPGGEGPGEYFEIKFELLYIQFKNKVEHFDASTEKLLYIRGGFIYESDDTRFDAVGGDVVGVDKLWYGIQFICGKRVNGAWYEFLIYTSHVTFLKQGQWVG